MFKSRPQICRQPLAAVCWLHWQVCVCMYVAGAAPCPASQSPWLTPWQWQAVPRQVVVVSTWQWPCRHLQRWQAPAAVASSSSSSSSSSGGKQQQHTECGWWAEDLQVLAGTWHAHGVTLDA
jgi:hypothetical protein